MTFAVGLFWLLPLLVFGPGVLAALIIAVWFVRVAAAERRDGRRAVEDMERLCALEALLVLDVDPTDSGDIA